MTVTTTVSKVTHSANGVTTVWPFAFVIPTAADVEVIVTSPLGVETTLPPSSFTVAGLNTASGGEVTYPLSGSPLVAGNKLTIRRLMKLKQETDLVTGAPLYAEDIEKAFDLLTMLCQQLQEQVDRSVKTSISSSISPDDLVAEISNSEERASAAADRAEQARDTAMGAEQFADAAALARDAAQLAAANAAASAGLIHKAVGLDYIDGTDTLRLTIYEDGDGPVNRASHQVIGLIAPNQAVTFSPQSSALALQTNL